MTISYYVYHLSYSWYWLVMLITCTQCSRGKLSESFHLVTVTVASSLVSNSVVFSGLLYKENQGSTINR